MKNLGDGAHRGRTIKRGLVVDNMKRLDCDILEQRGSAGRGPLAETRPVVDDGDPWRITPDKDDSNPPLVVLGDSRDPVGKHGARGIELLAVQEESVAGGREARLKVKDGFLCHARQRHSQSDRPPAPG